MRMTNLHIQGFRSAHDLALTDCGACNVLIGRNNSGKSNVLLAIDAFFSAISPGLPVNTHDDAQLLRIDHSNNDTHTPVSVTAHFLMGAEFSHHLAAAIRRDAPQISQLADSLPTSLALGITVTWRHLHPTHAHVSQIDAFSANTNELLHTLLKVPDAAAHELGKQQAQIDHINSDYEVLRTLPPALLRDLYERQSTERERYRTSMASRRLADYGLSAPTRRQLQEYAESAETSDAFVRQVAQLTDTFREDLDQLYAMQLTNRVHTLSGDESAVPRYVSDILTAVSSFQPLHLQERKEPIGQQEAERLLDLKVRRGGTDQLRNVQQTVKSLLDVDIDAFRSDENMSPRRRPEPVAELDVDNFLVQANGAGIRESLRLVLDYILNEPNLMLVEEPEVHLHPALETAMMQYLKSISSDCQIFFTTHSPYFLDTGDLRNVYLLTKHEGSTHANLLAREDAEAEIPHELGLRLSSVFMHDRLVFVEGESDEEIVRKFACLLEVNLANANVGFVHTEGSRNIQYFAQTKTLEFLSRRRVQLHLLMDRDERSESELQKLGDSIGDKADKHVLQRREIENYLLSTSALCRFINFKRHLAGLDELHIAQAEINEAIDHSADALYEFTVQKAVQHRVCTPIAPGRDTLHADQDTSLEELCAESLNRARQHLAERADAVAGICAEERDRLQRGWADHKLSLVPGVELLDAVAQNYGVRYRKARDGARLAGMLSPDEIPREFRDIIMAIAR